MNWGVLAVVLGAVTVVWGSAFFGWRWTRKRLGLDAPDAPDMGRREKSVRRSLRALLAFNFFVTWPVGLPACVMLIVMIFEERDLVGPSVAGLLGMVLFTVAVPSLIRTARQLERQRLSGEPDAVPPSVWIEGGLALLSSPGSAGARLVRYAFIAVLVVAGILNWKMTLAVMFYGGIAIAVWLGWTWMTRRRRQ